MNNLAQLYLSKNKPHLTHIRTMTHAEIKSNMNALLNRLNSAVAIYDDDGKELAQGDGFNEFISYLKRNSLKSYNSQTLRNYREGVFGKGKANRQGNMYSALTYEKKYNELKPLVEKYLQDLSVSDSFLLLNGTKWYVYFLNWEPNKEVYNIGRAIVIFSMKGKQGWAILENIPGSENTRKEGLCEIHNSALFLHLKSDKVADSHLHMTIDISGDLVEHEIIVGGYQSREDKIVIVGTILFKKIKDETPEAMVLSIRENPLQFSETEYTIKEFLAQKSQNMLRIFPNSSGDLAGLQKKMDRHRKKASSRLITTFVEPDRPRVFLSSPNSLIKTSIHKEVSIKINALKSKLEKCFNSKGSSKKIWVEYAFDRDNADFDFMEVMNKIKRTKIFVFIHPYDEPVMSTALLELGWAFMAVENILVYNKPDSLPERLVNYLNGTENIVQKTMTEFDYEKIFKDISVRIEKIYAG